MARYRKKPVVVEAIQFDGTNAAEIALLLGWEWTDGEARCDTVVIETLEGEMTAQIGDWIIKGVAGEGYPCQSDIFERTYDLVGDDDFPGPCERRLDLLETDVTG